MKLRSFKNTVRITMSHSQYQDIQDEFIQVEQAIKKKNMHGEHIILYTFKERERFPNMTQLLDLFDPIPF